MQNQVQTPKILDQVHHFKVVVQASSPASKRSESLPLRAGHLNSVLRGTGERCGEQSLQPIWQSLLGKSLTEKWQGLRQVQAHQFPAVRFIRMFHKDVGNMPFA